MCTGDLSSISGSESDDDDDTSSGHTHLGGTNHSPYLHFSAGNSAGSHAHFVYRCIVCNRSGGGGMGSGEELQRSLQRLGQPQVWLILMRSGGHFAGAVFRG